MSPNKYKVRWNDDTDIKLLMDGKIPPGRTPKAARARCFKLGIPLKGDLLNVDMSPARFYKEYPREILSMLSEGDIPDGWSYELCRYVSRTRLGKPFRPSKSHRATEKFKARMESIVHRIQAGETQVTVAESMGLSHQRISQMLSRYRAIVK